MYNIGIGWYVTKNDALKFIQKHIYPPAIMDDLYIQTYGQPQIVCEELDKE